MVDVTMQILLMLALRKMCTYSIISGPYLPVFGLNTEIYSVRTWKTPNTDTLDAA